MSYYHEDSEYPDDGYYDDGDHGYESDRAESLYSDPDPAPSEPYDNVDHEDETDTRWETSTEISEYKPEGLEYRHENEAKGGEYEGDVYRHREHGDALCSNITLLKLLIYKNARQTNPSFAGYG
jgi:hypothetical protein